MSDNPLPKCRNCNHFVQTIYSGICYHLTRSAYYNRVNGMDPACVWFEPLTITDSSITMTKGGKSKPDNPKGDGT